MATDVSPLKLSRLMRLALLGIALLACAYVLVRANILTVHNATSYPIKVSVHLSNGGAPGSRQTIAPRASSMFIFLRLPKRREGAFELSIDSKQSSIAKTCGYIDFSPTVHTATVSDDGSKLTFTCQTGWLSAASQP